MGKLIGGDHGVGHLKLYSIVGNSEGGDVSSPRHSPPPTPDRRPYVKVDPYIGLHLLTPPTSHTRADGANDRR